MSHTRFVPTWVRGCEGRKATILRCSVRKTTRKPCCPSAPTNRPTNRTIAPQEAIRRIRSTGANVRTQAPLINHVNADAATWASMWRLQTRLGAIPYYMFVERDTGARKYFEVNELKEPPGFACCSLFDTRAFECSKSGRKAGVCSRSLSLSARGRSLSSAWGFRDSRYVPQTT